MQTFAVQYSTGAGPHLAIQSFYILNQKFALPSPKPSLYARAGLLGRAQSWASPIDPFLLPLAVPFPFHFPSRILFVPSINHPRLASVLAAFTDVLNVSPHHLFQWVYHPLNLNPNLNLSRHPTTPVKMPPPLPPKSQTLSTFHLVSILAMSFCSIVAAPLCQ